MAAEDVTMQLLSTSLKVIAVCNNFAPLPGSIRMWKTGKTEGWPTIYFVIGLCGSLGMILYGLLQNNQTLFMINSLQATCGIYYITSYMVLSSNKSEKLSYIFGAVAYLSGLYACFMAYESHETDKRLDLLGTASGGVFFLMNCSTFLDVITAIRLGAAQFDMIMLVFGMLNTLLWLAYGIILNDVYIYGPCIPFVVSGLMKFVLLGVYSSQPLTETKKAKKTQ